MEDRNPYSNPVNRAELNASEVDVDERHELFKDWVYFSAMDDVTVCEENLSRDNLEEEDIKSLMMAIWETAQGHDRTATIKDIGNKINDNLISYFEAQA